MEGECRVGMGLFFLLKHGLLCSECETSDCAPCDASVNLTCQAAKIIAEVLRSGDPAYFARHFETSVCSNGDSIHDEEVDLESHPSRFGGRVLMTYYCYDYPQGGTISVSLVRKPVLD